jgi:hypothetical protein
MRTDFHSTALQVGEARRQRALHLRHTPPTHAGNCFAGGWLRYREVCGASVMHARACVREGAKTGETDSGTAGVEGRPREECRQVCKHALQVCGGHARSLADAIFARVRDVRSG